MGGWVPCWRAVMSEYPAKSPFFQRLRVEHWNVEKSTDPDDIFWSGLAQRCSSLYWLRTVFINCALFIIMLFFTTPSIAVNNIEKLKWLGIDFNFTQIIDIPSFSWFSNFLPTLMLWTFAAIYFFHKLSSVIESRNNKNLHFFN